jgi:hypothetical protein
MEAQMRDNFPGSQPPIIAPAPPSYAWNSLQASRHAWLAVAISFISFIALVCILGISFLVHAHGSGAFLPLVFFGIIGIIAAAGVTSAVFALIRAWRAKDWRLVVLAAIGLVLNSFLLVWAVRVIGMVATHYART